MADTKRTIEERVSDKEAQLKKMLEKAKQYERQLKLLEKTKKNEDRKKRTHRLIEIGAGVESVLGVEIDENLLPLFINHLKFQEEKGRYISRALGIQDTKAETSSPNTEHI